MKKKILVVDDQKNTLKVISANLEVEGYNVFTAQSAQEALHIFDSHKDIDVVLADLKMPGINGLELYRKMSAIEVDIPYVIMTAHGTIESAVEAVKEGVTNYLIKPVNSNPLIPGILRSARTTSISLWLSKICRASCALCAVKTL